LCPDLEWRPYHPRLKGKRRKRGIGKWKGKGESMEGKGTL